MQTVAPETWEQMQFLFHLVCDKSETELEHLLVEACPDPMLRAEVKLLVRAARVPASALADTADATQAHRKRIGPHKVVRHLGSGGTGSVYLIERRTGASVQMAALKVFPGYEPESFFTRSFAREEFILASMTHPSIPRLLEAGVSETGEPFLVMEYVEGLPLDAFCDAGRLSVEARLRLMLRVCDAVAYAHRNLVVHLDLKPSNILATTDEPQIRLLDFGTSKLLEAGRTLAIAQMVTPAYAAPEQLRNEPSTTSCDVYSVGAILFELLCGRQAFPDTSLAAMAERSAREMPVDVLEETATEAAAERRGVSLPTLRRQLSGDLATIVSKCLAPEPKNRYSSMDALREDIQRYLSGRTIIARPQTRRYRLWKFVRRNRVSVPVALLAACVLLVSLGIATLRQHEARVAAERAQKMQNFLYSVLRLANTNYSGHPLTTIDDFLHLSVQALPEYIHDPVDQRSGRLSLAESMFDNSDYAHALPTLLATRDQAHAAGDVAQEAEADAFAGMTESELGHAAEASTLLNAAMAMRNNRALTPAQRLWIVGFYVSDRYNQGVRSPGDASLLESAIAEARRSQVPTREMAWAIGNLATMHSRLFRVDDAERETEETLALLRKEPYTTCDQAMVLNTLGDLDAMRHEDALALTHHQQAYNDIVACKGPNDLSALELQISLARLMVGLNRGDDAARLLEPSIAVWKSDLPGNPEIGYAYTVLAQARLLQRRYPEAVQLSRQGMEAEEGKFAANGLAIGLTEAVLAQGLRGEGNKASALTYAKAAAKIFSAQPNLSPNSRRVASENDSLLKQVQ